MFGMTRWHLGERQASPDNSPEAIAKRDEEILAAQIAQKAEVERLAALEHAPAVEVPGGAGLQVFDPAEFDFQPHAYRVHFKNGHSGEYDGAALAGHFPFDPAQVDSVEPVAQVEVD